MEKNTLNKPGKNTLTKALVTGGAGFIGSHLTEALLLDGHEVRVLDNFATGHRENLEAVLDRIELIEDSITEPEVCARACAGVDWVFHQAAIPSVPRSVADPATSHQANATGTLNMLVAARDAGAKRFIYAASSSAYGDTPTLPKVETMRSNPMSPYAAQKLLGETYCKQFHMLYGLETVALRYFNIFGPRQDSNSPYGGVIPKFISAFLNHQPIVVYGDGTQTRDFTYIDNAINANLLAAECTKAACGMSYNIACGERYSLNDIIQRLDSSSIEYKDSRPGDILDSQADITQAEQRLNYKVSISFQEGLEKTIPWYMKQS